MAFFRGSRGWVWGRTQAVRGTAVTLLAAVAGCAADPQPPSLDAIYAQHQAEIARRAATENNSRADTRPPSRAVYVDPEEMRRVQRNIDARYEREQARMDAEHAVTRALQRAADN